MTVIYSSSNRKPPNRNKMLCALSHFPAELRYFNISSQQENEKQNNGIC